jgi:threonine synthase
MQDLARFEGVFAEPSGAAGLAGLKPLLEQGRLEPSDRVVVLVTGSGLKDIDAVALGDVQTIAPGIDALAQQL